MPGDNVVAFIRDKPDEGSGDGVVHAMVFVLLLASLPIDLQNRDGTEQISTRPPTISVLARSEVTSDGGNEWRQQQQRRGVPT